VKKAILFTMMAYFLFVGILTVSFGYQEQSKKMQQYLSDLNYLRKIYYIETDVADDFYDMIGMDMNIGRTETNAWIDLSKINLQSYDSTFSAYTSYMTTTYADLTNTVMNLTINPEFMINDNSNFTVNSTEIRINNLGALEGVTVHINSEQSLSVESTAEIRSVSDPQFTVVLFDTDGSVLSNRSNPTRYILGTGANERVISVDFVNDELVISRAQFSGITGLTANASLIRLHYDNATDIKLTTGEFQTGKFRGVRKNGYVVLARG